MARRIRARRLSQQQRLERLERERNRELDKMAAARYGPILRSESSRVSSGNAAFRRQTSGLTRSGKTSTVSGRKSYAVKRKTMTEQRRALIEKDVEAYVRANPSSPIAREWLERDQEIDELRAAGEQGFLGEGGAGRVHVRAYCVKPHTRTVRVRATA